MNKIMPMNVTIKNKILKDIFNSIDNNGSTIQNIIDKTGYARGTIKTYLMVLCFNKNIKEICYNQNVKVYHKSKKKKEKMKDEY